MLSTEKSVYEDVKSFAKKWWVFLILGILSVGLSIYMMFNQLIAYEVLSIIFAVFFLVTGILRVVFVIGNRKSIPAWGWSLIPALLMVFVGASLCFTDYMSEIVMLNVYAIGVIFVGINTIFSMGLMEGFGWKLLSILFGILTVGAGFMMIMNPVFGILTVVLLAAIGLMISGISNIAAAYHLSVLKSQLK